MPQVFRLSIPVELELAIMSGVVDGVFMVSIASTTDYSKLSWSVSGVKPFKTIVVDRPPPLGGTLVILLFRHKDVLQFNLLTGSVQMEFTGSDLLNYLTTAETGFGVIIQPPSDSFTPVLVVGGLLATIGIVAAIVANSSGNITRRDSKTDLSSD